jgi:hypothetical protein
MPTEPVADATEAEKERGRRRRRGGRGRGRPGEEREATVADTPPPRREDQELTLSEAFHLLSRALGELPAPAPHEVLRARMAALHGREDHLLEPEAFPRLLRQANDAEVADVRLVAEGEYEVSPHKSDLAMQVRPMADPNAAGAAGNLPARPAAALRYRSGSQATKRSGQLAMVGVVQLDGEPTPAAADVAPVAEAKPAKKSGRAKTAKPKAKTAKTASASKKPAAPKVAKAAAKPADKAADKAATKSAKRPAVKRAKRAAKPAATLTARNRRSSMGFRSIGLVVRERGAA